MPKKRKNPGLKTTKGLHVCGGTRAGRMPMYLLSTFKQVSCRAKTIIAIEDEVQQK